MTASHPGPNRTTSWMIHRWDKGLVLAFFSTNITIITSSFGVRMVKCWCHNTLQQVSCKDQILINACSLKNTLIQHIIVISLNETKTFIFGSKLTANEFTYSQICKTGSLSSVNKFPFIIFLSCAYVSSLYFLVLRV